MATPRRYFTASPPHRDGAGLPRPVWARRVPGLPEPWATPGTPAMQETIRAATPRVLAERGLSIDKRSLWREPATGASPTAASAPQPRPISHG